MRSCSAVLFDRILIFFCFLPIEHYAPQLATSTSWLAGHVVSLRLDYRLMVRRHDDAEYRSMVPTLHVTLVLMFMPSSLLAGDATFVRGPDELAALKGISALFLVICATVVRRAFPPRQPRCGVLPVSTVDDRLE